MSASIIPRLLTRSAFRYAHPRSLGNRTSSTARPNFNMSTYSAAPSWSRLIRFIAQEDGQEYMGEPVDSDLDVGTAEPSSIQVHKLSGAYPWDAKKESSPSTLTVKELLCPLKKDEVNTIRCIGLNYKDHAEEAKIPLPEVITLFHKPRTALTGPGKVYVPKCVQDESSDYESELCVVIGQDCKDVPEDRALDYVLAYCSSNDISSRKAQFAQSQWCRSKGFDWACPIGPCLVSPARFPKDKGSPIVQVTGKLNGKVRQSAPTSNLVFSVAQIVSFLSQGTTLERGSIILTGTPAGVGTFDKPMTYLKDGDVFEVEISGGLGTLRNTIVYE